MSIITQTLDLIFAFFLYSFTMRNQPSREQKPSSHMNQSSILCKHCGKKIIADNYLIHQARCALVSSRVYMKQEEEKPQMNYSQTYPVRPPPQPQANFRKYEQKQQIRPNIQQRFSNNRERPRIFQKRQQQREAEERIPCPFCGYGQTLAELDTHPLTCQHRQQECEQCGGKFPRSLMGQHHQICANSHRENQNMHNHSQQWIDHHQQEEDYNPFGNFTQFLQQVRRNQNQPRIQQRQQRPQRNNNQMGGVMIVQRRDAHGNIIREIYRNNSPSQGFINPNRNPGYQSPYSPFTNFFAILELMAARHSHHSQDQGMTKEEIKALKKITYKGNNQRKKQNEKDLCTICYCQFEQGEKLVQLRCKHIYHQECITKWVEKTAKCPVCKAPQTDRPMASEDDI